MKHTFEQLDQLAHAHEYDSYKDLLCDWYLGNQLGLYEIGDRLGISWFQVRQHLQHYGIQVRKRGGPNNVAIVVTLDLVREVARDGISTVSQRLGVHYTALLPLIKRWVKENPNVEITLPD